MNVGLIVLFNPDIDIQDIYSKCIYYSLLAELDYHAHLWYYTW